ncbi:MAG: hypothetical protein B0A82_03415 [Alkalinema sp. CACIAM 70d]|nr:MAG: hypothetical protein B0A82_03415 [Alkalinema sp. CACIAM 70d]
MKVQLERRLPSCPEQLECVICHQKFIVPRIRRLLCNDEGLIQGDLCPHCLKLKTAAIQHKLRQQSGQLLQQANHDRDQSLSLRQRGLELLTLSQESLTRPSLYTWLSKRLEVLSQETQELEAARLGLQSCACGHRSKLRILFEDPGDPE